MPVSRPRPCAALSRRTQRYGQSHLGAPLLWFPLRWQIAAAV